MKNVERYIQEEKIEKNQVVNRLLRIIERNEQNLNKNVEEFSTDELLNMFVNQSQSGIANLRSFLSKYFDYLVSKKCLDDNIFLTNKDLSLRNINQQKLKSNDVFTEDDFKILMLNLTGHRHIQFILYAAYSGITLRDLSKVKLEDLDFANKKVHLKNKDIHVDDEFIRLYELFYKTNARVGLGNINNEKKLISYKHYILKYADDPKIKNIETDERFEALAERQWSRYLQSVLNYLNYDITLASIKKYGVRDKFVNLMKESNIKITSENIGGYVNKFCKENKMSYSSFYHGNIEYFTKVFNLE